MIRRSASPMPRRFCATCKASRSSNKRCSQWLACWSSLLEYSGTRSYLDSLPNVPFAQLPPQVQRDFLDKVRQGKESLDYLRRTHDITASADAAQYFADAYRLHEKDPLAVSGLATAADYAIDWYRKLPDQHEARAELERFRAKSDYYERYRPLQKAIRAAGGE